MNLYNHHHSNTSIQSHILTLFYTERLAHFSCLTPLIDAYIDGCRAALWICFSLGSEDRWFDNSEIRKRIFNMLVYCHGSCDIAVVIRASSSILYSSSYYTHHLYYSHHHHYLGIQKSFVMTLVYYLVINLKIKESESYCYVYLDNHNT